MKIDELEKALSKYVPAGALQCCVDWIVDHRIVIRITKSRSSKFGDYAPPSNGRGHRISINHDLNQYAFLLTFTHEVAHLLTWNRFRNKVDAHGAEWKNEFKTLLVPLIKQDIFPDDLSTQLESYIAKPTASSCSDIDLSRVLSRYDKSDELWFRLEDVPINAHFRIRSGRKFIKGNRLRKNYCCIDIQNNHHYHINPMTEVQCIDVPNQEQIL